ncbi:MAG: hypothetical protein WCF62_31610, partial [Pseudolabrys sp.]
TCLLLTQSGRGSVQSCSGTAFAADALPPLAASQNVRWYIKSEFIIGADGFRICWAHKNNTLGGDHAATSQISSTKAADWPAPLPGMRAADVSCLY